MSLRRLAPLIAVLASLLAAAPARAATVYVTGNGQSKVVHYEAAPGETNLVSVKVMALWPDTLRFEAGPPPTAGAGCEEITDVYGTVVTCPKQGVIRIDATLGDGDDRWDSPMAVPVHVEGEAGNDALNGGTADDVVDGGPGDDTFQTQELWGPSPGADEWIGGEGSDWITYEGRSFDPLTITLDDAANDGLAGENDNVRSDIESVSGGYGADSITGSAGPDRLFGDDGVDHLDGAGGNDYLADGMWCTADELDGGAGDDRVFVDGANIVDAGPGNDKIESFSLGCPGSSIQGGDGTDLVDLSRGGSAVVVTLDDVADDGPLGFPDWGSNVASDIEDVIGTYGSDVLIGSDGSNAFDGGPGDDVIDGGGGSDALGGGGGFDAVDYSTRAASVSVDLDGAAGDDGEAGEGDTVQASVESIWTGGGDDVLTGNGDDNAFDGGPGADVMTGGGGQDAVDYSLRSGAVTADLSGSQGDDGEAGEGDSIAGDIEDLYGGGGNDSLTGSSVANFLDGGAGDDLMSLVDAIADSGVCGDGNDRVTADDLDAVEDDCEDVQRTVPATPAGPGTTTTPTSTLPPRLASSDVLGTRGTRPQDTTPPTIALRQVPTTLSKLLRSGQVVDVICSEQCGGTLHLTLTAAAAKRLGIKTRGSGPVRIGTGLTAGMTRGRFQMRIRIKAAYRRRLAKAKHPRITLSARLQDPDGNERMRVTTLKLKTR